MKDIVFRILSTTLSTYRRKCPLDITDLVSLEIENKYMKEYEAAINYKERIQLISVLERLSGNIGI